MMGQLNRMIHAPLLPNKNISLTILEEEKWKKELTDIPVF